MSKDHIKRCRPFYVIFFTLLFFSLYLPGNCALAQDSLRAYIGRMVSDINRFTENRGAERLYLQTDKPDYITGDTLWFKAYLMDAAYLYASSGSGIVYTEIANDSNRVIRRIMSPVFMGLSYGQIALASEDMPQGGYVLRSYTNHMRNFGEDYVFKRHFYISAPAEQDWLIDYHARELKEAGTDKIGLRLKFSRFDKRPVGLRELQLRITDGKRTLFRGNTETTIEGIAAISFDLPEKARAKNITLNIQDMRKGSGNRSWQVPVALNRPEHTDLQFMPEGGSMVAGLPVCIAFKAVGEDGRSADVSGKVYNSRSQEVAVFSSSHKGVGTFHLIPEAGETYTAVVVLPGGVQKTYMLPAVKTSGISLEVNNHFRSDSCEVVIRATRDIAAAGRTWFLVAHTRGIACYGASFTLRKDSLKLMVSKSLFPGGIARFTVAAPDKTALSERMVYIDHGDDLCIDVRADKAVYGQRDSVVIDITVTNKEGVPVQGSFSLAVTDDGQVKTDSVANGSLVGHMLLTSGLKGAIENPGYYLRPSSGKEKWQHLDQLLLAQGWTEYGWNDIFRPAKPFAYAAEQEFLVKGKVTNAFNKPVAGSGITLFSRNPLLVMDTVTNDQGAFVFKGIFPADTAVFFIQARNKKGKSFNVGIETEEFNPPVFVVSGQRKLPWYANIDTGSFAVVNRQVQLKKEQVRITGGHLLHEVVITGKKIVKDSKNLNGPGEADIIIDEKDLEKAGRSTLGDLLYKRVPGFGIRADKSGKLSYRINTMIVHLIIDGMDTEFFLPEGIPLDQYFKQYFDYYDAEEIKGIEVMTSSRYEGRYRTTYLDPLAEPWSHAFIEVTTRGGKGPFVKKSVGTYIYRPMPFTLPKKFYSPPYTSESRADMTDIRSTIFWEPNIVTDRDGRATVSFCTADQPGSYSLMIEGSDMKGGLGYSRTRLLIRKR